VSCNADTIAITLEGGGEGIAGYDEPHKRIAPAHS